MVGGRGAFARTHDVALRSRDDDDSAEALAQAEHANEFSTSEFRFIGGRGGDEGPAHEGDDEPSAHACANEYEVLRVDRSPGAHVDDVHRGDEDARVPRLRVNGRARGAQSGASIHQKSSAVEQARKGATVLREAKAEKA